MKKLSPLFIFSLFLNLMFFGLGSLLIYRRGGIPYFISKVGLSLPSGKVSTRYIDSPQYLELKSTYANSPRKDTAIIFTGDSITQSGPWNELLQRPVLNRGIGGDTAEGLRDRIDEVLRHHPHQLFIMIGINSLREGKTSAQVLDEYLSLIKYIKTTLPSTQIFLQSILPVNNSLWQANILSQLRPDLTQYILEVNKGLAGIANGKQIVYVDLYSKMVSQANQLNNFYTTDGLHLNGYGYIKWAYIIRPYLASEEKQTHTSNTSELPIK